MIKSRYKIKVKPMGAPRMTRRDKWKKRPVILRYHAFRDIVRLSGAKMTEGDSSLEFHIPMAKSWSKKKKEQMNGQPHQQKPDKDNLEKALLDALFKDDSKVWRTKTVEKRWCYEGEERIVIKNDI